MNMTQNTNRLLATLLLVPLLIDLPVAIQAGTRVTLDSLLNEMVDVESIARWPEHEFTGKQASSYDRAKIAPDKPGWFANIDNTQYIRTEETEGRKENVMMEADGPGAIVRFWLTAGGPKDGILRIYLDGDKAPAITFSEFSLLKGNVRVNAPLAQAHPGERGNNLYLPIPYAKHCKVTWEEGKKGARYYQINYRTYAAGTEVKTFALPQVEASRDLIDQVNRTLESPMPSSDGKVSTVKEMLAAGAEASLDLPTGNQAVRTLELLLKSDDTQETERTLRSIIVKLTFDGDVTVWCPATDFFGSGVGINELRSWYRTISTDGTMRCRWVMPYEKTARVTLLNVGSKPVNAVLHATTAPWTWDNRSMHFYAAWHHEAGLKTPPLRDWNFITITGRGVYAGDSLALFNPVATWYGEGDEKIWVDGESFPSHFGTGTEDYYCYAWGDLHLFQGPFANQVRCDGQSHPGHTVVTRTRTLDAIPFTKSLLFDMEVWHQKDCKVGYAATTYWYALPGATSNRGPSPDEAVRPISPIPQ